MPRFHLKADHLVQVFLNRVAHCCWSRLLGFARNDTARACHCEERSDEQSLFVLKSGTELTKSNTWFDCVCGRSCTAIWGSLIHNLTNSVTRITGSTNAHIRVLYTEPSAAISTKHAVRQFDQNYLQSPQSIDAEFHGKAVCLACQASLFTRLLSGTEPYLLFVPRVDANALSKK